jgi:manganese/iron transport system permease protein
VSPIDFLTDLLNPDLAFLGKALAVAVMSSIVCGVVGCYVVLRGMAFIGEAVAHAVFPGLAIAFALSGNLVAGGTVAGVVTAVLVALFSQNRRLKEDSVIGVMFVAAFASGLVIISQTPGYAGSLQQFLFGSITGVPDSDLYVVAGTGLLVLGGVFAFHKELVTVSLDRESARAMGLSVFWLELALYVLVTLAVVISVQTIGNILVLALLVTPAATARLLTDRLGVMMLLAPLIGGVSALAGLYLSWSWDLPVGGTIVLVLTAVFLACWLGAPRHGLISKTRARRGKRTRRGGQTRRGTAPGGDAGADPPPTPGLRTSVRALPLRVARPGPAGAPEPQGAPSVPRPSPEPIEN